MEFNTEIRKKQLENLAQFISTSRDKVEAILSSLNWSVEEVTKVNIQIWLDGTVKCIQFSFFKNRRNLKCPALLMRTTNCHLNH